MKCSNIETTNKKIKKFKKIKKEKITENRQKNKESK